MRVMTYNIWNYNSNWEARRALIAAIIEAEQPEVVALQETRHDFRFEGGKGQGEQLAGLTGYHPTSAVAQVYLPLLRVDEGLTILTRQPPNDVAVCRLTLHPHDREDENHRICLGVRLDRGGQPLHIFDTHFSLSPSARITNGLEVARFVAERAGAGPAVLMGDLNAEPEETPIRFLTGEEELDGEAAGFLDCWTAVNPDAPGYTYASFDPVRRIDYVLGWQLPAGPISARVVGGEAVDGVYPSDHMGIVADLPL